MDNQIWGGRRIWRDSYRFSLTFQMIGLVLLLLLVCTILVRIYAGVMTTSLQAEALNKSVLLCRNTGELFTERGDLEETVSLLGAAEQPDAGYALLYFDRELHCVPESDGWLALELREDAGQTQRNGIKTCDMEVTQDGKSIYRLSVQVYVPEERA